MHFNGVDYNIGWWFTNVSSTVYNEKWELTSFTADWISYTLTYEKWRLKTVNDWSLTYTMTYTWGKLTSITSS